MHYFSTKKTKGNLKPLDKRTEEYTNSVLKETTKKRKKELFSLSVENKEIRRDKKMKRARKKNIDKKKDATAG